MARKQNIVRPVKLHTHIPEDLRAQLDLHLYSNLEGRVPHGAYGRFFEALLKDYFSKTSLDVSAYIAMPPSTAKVWGSPDVIEAFQQYLEAKTCSPTPNK